MDDYEPSDGALNNQVIMSDSRDFSRPKEPFYQSTVPLDSHYAQDIADSPIAQIKNILKNNPLGRKYQGEINGLVDSELISILLAFESTLQIKTGEPIIGTIVSGNSVSPKAFFQALKLLKQPQEDKLKEIPKEPSKTISSNSDLIKQFQIFFKLPSTGVIDLKLIEAAKSAENQIANSLKDNSVKGMLFDEVSKSFKTSPQDLQQALKLLKDHWK